MDTEQVYDFIGNLALALYVKKIQISLSSLNSILDDMGAKYGSNRGLASGVSAAYRHWESKDPVVHNAIAHSFKNQQGEFAWLGKE